MMDDSLVKMTKTNRNAVLAELAPQGVIRAGVVEAPHGGVFFIVRDTDTGLPKGVTVDLAAGLAQSIGVPVEYRIFPNSGECTDAVEAGEIDVAFMPVDEERRKRIAFGPAYYLLGSTYMVSAASGIQTIAEVDRPEIRVVGIANTTTIRASGRTLTQTAPTAARSVEEAIALFRDGLADALALSHESLTPLLPRFPGARVLEGAFQETSISIAVQKGRSAALSCVTEFMEHAKASGMVRSAFDRLGLQAEEVAPPGR